MNTIYIYIYIGGEVVDIGLLDYVFAEGTMIKRLKDLYLFMSEVASISNHFWVEKKFNVLGEWMNNVRECKREEVKVEELTNVRKWQEYQKLMREWDNEELGM